MSQFIASIKDVKNNYKLYDKWEQQQDDDVAKRRYLSDKLELPKDEVVKTKNKAEIIFRATDILDKKSEDSCANMEQTTGLVSLAILSPLAIAPTLYQQHLQKKGKVMTTKQSALFIVATLVAGMGSILWSNSKQKEASRIGRFKARQHELKDPKNFVIYTPEQIDTAKNTNYSNTNKINIYSDSKFKQISKDKNEYKLWQQKKQERENELNEILNKKYTSEQLLQGEKDKEIIVNIVKDVNMSAETYAENVENAFNVISFMSFITNIPIFIGTNKILNKLKNVSDSLRKTVPIMACAAFTIPMTIIETNAKKQGARVGRYKKRQEILDNPELIMSYSKEQLKLAEKVYAPKLKNKFTDKIAENIKFFGIYFKDLKQYKAYTKSEEKNNIELYKKLLNTEVSDTQMKAAINLQEKTFRTFDKMDEMSQRYSEDTEAATQLVKQLTTSLTPLIGFAIPLGLVYSMKKGEFPLNKLINFVSNISLKQDASLKSFIQQASTIIDNDKSLKKDFSKIFISKKSQNNVLTNPKIKHLFKKLISEDSIFSKQFNELLKAKDLSEIEKIGKFILDNQLKDDKFSLWVRNLVTDVCKLKLNNKLKKLNISKEKVTLTKQIQNFFDNYKTLSKTIIFGGFAPIIGVIVGIPLIISSLFTNIQLKAGKIGIMKAMDEIDKPELFVDKE